MSGDIFWLIPAGREVYRSKDEIKTIFERISNRLLGEKRTLAVTGMPGAGKTVLFDYLTGEAYKQGYKPPLTSQAVESRHMAARKNRIMISVIPGQSSEPRYKALDKIFLSKNPVDGVIHVVSYGFPAIRAEGARKGLLREGKSDNLEAFHKNQLNEELKDLEATCDFISKSHNKHRKPTWLLIAVAKVDLYYHNIEEAQKYYSPYDNSEFTKKLSELEHKLGKNYFRWESVPVCSWLEDFVWNGQTCSSVLKDGDRSFYLKQFVDQLENYCKSA